MCNMDCFNCQHVDCINTSPATAAEIGQINSTSKECKEYRTTQRQRDRMKKYRAEHREELQQYMRSYASGNVVIQQYNKDYYQTHKDEFKRRAQGRVLTAEQRQHKNEQAKEYKQRPEVKERRRAYQIAYRARKKAEREAQ